MTHKIEIRPIQKKDNLRLAQIIRQVLTEHKANLEGTAFTDVETDCLYETYKTKKGAYFVALIDDEIVGGSGIALLNKDFPKTCELQKMYLLPEARGLKIGDKLIESCFNFAQKQGFKNCYLETFATMKRAHDFYLKKGFVFREKPLVKSCHTACHIYMYKTF
ncbi:MAG: GNAT family N-acetyltransferase [Flavobacteriaceae bacterium]